MICCIHIVPLGSLQFKKKRSNVVDFLVRSWFQQGLKLNTLGKIPKCSCRYEEEGITCKTVRIAPDRVHDLLMCGRPIEYGGFCPVCFVRNGGILWRGDPAMGLVQTQDMKLYSFGDEDSLQRYRV